MISKYNHKELNWIDLESPREDEIMHIIEKYPIPSSIKDKIISKNIEEKMEINDEFIYISIKNKIIFIVSEKIVISIHDKPMNAFTTFSKEMELDMVSDEKINNNNILFANLLKNLYINQEIQIEASENKIKTLKNQVLKNHKNIKKLNIFLILSIILLIIFIWL